MLAKRLIMAVKPGIRSMAKSTILRSNRSFSEFFDPYPATNSIQCGQYLIQAVHDGELRTVEDILESGINPNHRTTQVDLAQRNVILSFIPQTNNFYI